MYKLSYKIKIYRIIVLIMNYTSSAHCTLSLWLRPVITLTQTFFNPPQTSTHRGPYNHAAVINAQDQSVTWPSRPAMYSVVAEWTDPQVNTSQWWESNPLPYDYESRSTPLRHHSLTCKILFRLTRHIVVWFYFGWTPMVITATETLFHKCWLHNI
jgi:hypothetical protein